MNLFQKLFKKNKPNQGVAALSFTPEGIALAISQFNKSNKKQELIHCEFIPTKSIQPTLNELTEKHQLTKYDTHLVLHANDYRLVTIEAPAVPDDEISQAIRWKISDLIDFHIDDAVTDFYPLPKSDRANSEEQLEVVATKKSMVQPLIDYCLNCKLQLKIIDIQETTLRNLATQLPENKNGVTLLYLQKKTGQIIIERQGLVYLNRKLVVGYDRLGLTDSFLGTEQIELEQNNLALDIQRSFDYVESYYGLPPTSGLMVIPVAENTQNIVGFLVNNHSIPAQVMNLSTLIESRISVDDATQSLCASVIGATLRNTLMSA